MAEEGCTTRYAFIEASTGCYESLMHIARKLGKKLKIEVVDVSRFDARHPQIVVVCKNAFPAEGFLENLVEHPESASNIKYLFVEQLGYHLPEELDKVFKIVPIDLDYDSELPACISLKELSYTISEQVKRECLRNKKHAVMDDIGRLTNTQLYKPKKAMSEVMKFLFKRKLEKYGSLEEVFKELQSN